MSNKYNYPISKAKEENKNQNERDSLYQLDVQLLSSLKPIPGKIIPLNNKMNQAYDNNKENNQDVNRKDTYNNIIKNDTINNINYMYSNDKMNIVNNNLNNNNFTTNNYFLNSGFNNTNMNFNSLNSYKKNNSGLIQNSFPAGDNQLLFPQSNHPSILSYKSDMKNNNCLWSDIKFTQNSYTHNLLLLNNENYNVKGNITRNNILNNNIRLSQLSYQLSNLGNDEIYKKKKSTSMILRKNSDNNNYNEDNINKSMNNEINFSGEKKKSRKQTKEKIINIKEEEKIEDNNIISQEKNKKIFFNIENFCDEDEEDDTIYYNINSNKNDVSNLFNCYLKKKKKRKKGNEVYKHKCLHPKCEFSYKTKKQLQNHHFKMTPECQLDSVQLIKLVHDTKIILKNIIQNNKNKKEKFEKLYDNLINKISLKNYFEFIAGSHFNDN